MEPTIVYTVRRQMSRIQALSFDERRRRPGLGHCSIECDAASTGKFPKMTQECYNPYDGYARNGIPHF